MLSVEEVKNIARLARIGLSDEEVPKYQKELSAILDFFKELEVVSTEGVLPMGNITGKSDALREDSVQSMSTTERDALIANMPAVKDGFVKVKSVF